MAIYQVETLSYLEQQYLDTIPNWNTAPDADIAAFKARINAHLSFVVETMAIGQSSIKIWYAQIKTGGELHKTKILVFDITTGAFGECDVSPRCASKTNVWFTFSELPSES